MNIDFEKKEIENMLVIINSISIKGSDIEEIMKIKIKLKEAQEKC